MSMRLTYFTNSYSDQALALATFSLRNITSSFDNC